MDNARPELLQARAAALSGQIPLMYALVLICMSALILTHLSSAPALLTLYIPGILTLFCCGRLLVWWRQRQALVTPAIAAAMMRQTLVFAAFLGSGFVAWAFSLAPYGGPFEQAHVAFFLGMTPVGCLFCLMHLRAAALVLATVVVVPTLVFFYLSGNDVLFMISINLALLIMVLMATLLRNSRDFDRLVESRREARINEEAAKALSEANSRLANIDGLTGLPNRRYFLQILTDRLQDPERAAGDLWVGIVDLDGFKAVNDVFGHAVGDRVLGEVGSRLDILRKQGAVVARLGGDEFGIMLVGSHSRDSIKAFGERLVLSFQEPFVNPGAVARLSGSCGFAVSLARDTSAAILARADYAAYEAKNRARGSVVCFSDVHEARIAADRKLEVHLLNADFAAELFAVYQPIVDIRTGEPVGYEALARWNSPSLGQVPPASFIPMAERLGLMPAITQAMVVHALGVVAQLPPPLRISVNLSVRDMASSDAMRALSQILALSPVRPGRIDFEITETAVMRDVGEAVEALLVLLAHGARISLDDFGTGYSSLTRVQMLPLDRIKIDRSFVAKIETDPTSQAIVKTTLELCQNLGLSCVIEGIETPAQAAALTALGARLFQGYHSGRPQLAEEIIALHQAEARALGAP